MRSIALATQTVSREPVIVRGSSIMNVISCRSIKRNCSSTPLSSRMISAAATASRRANASSAPRSIDSAASPETRISRIRGVRTTTSFSWTQRAARAILVASSPIRSRSVTARDTPMIRRRSLAAG